MNAALHTTFADLTRALAALKPATMGDFYAAMPERRFAFRVNFDAPSDMTVARALDLIDARIDRERKKYTSHHWSFDMNRFVAFTEMRADLAAFVRAA